MIRRLFSLTLPVDRRFYLIAGVVLMVVKYAIDALIVYAIAGRFWTPLDYLNPVFVMRASALKSGEAPAPEALLFVMALWALPFMWIGVTMTIRRAIDAGYSGWMGLLFFMPIVNYFIMLALAWVPSAPEVAQKARDTGRPAPVDDRIRSALLGLVVGLVISLAMLGLSVYVLGTYGTSLFVGTPFIVGATCG